MKRIIAKTPRTILRHFALKDAAAFFELNADPEVLRYTGDAPFKSVSQARECIRNYRHYQIYGYGRWSIILSSTKEYMGFCGLNFSVKNHEVDLGFRLPRRFWGQGFATETGFAALREGFSNYGLEKIVGRAMAENKASLHVLEKLGMTFEKEFEEENMRWVQMLLRREDFGMFYE